MQIEKTVSTARHPRTAGYVNDADRHVECPVTADQLEGNLDKLATHADPSAVVQIDRRTGSVDVVKEPIKNLPSSRQVLPLRLGALQRSLEGITRTDSWLSDRSPAFYFDKQGQVHVDFPSLAGFVVDPMGAIVFRAVNPF